MDYCLAKSQSSKLAQKKPRIPCEKQNIGIGLIVVLLYKLHKKEEKFMKVKKLLCLGLAAAISCSGLPVQAANAQEATAIGQEGTTKPAADSQADADEKFRIDSDGCLYKYYGEDQDVVIPEGVTSIGYCAFSNCSSLESISIPEGVSSIDESAFSGCSSLKAASLPKSLSSIRGSAFSNCSSLESLTIPEGVSSIEFNTFSNCSNLKDVSLPKSLSSIGDSAFYNCSSLESIIIPEGVTSICESAFWGCSSLKAASLPASVSSIDNYAFSGCSSLENISIPEGVSSIRHSTFYGCSNLKAVSIPASVSSIEGSAFEGCSSLESVSIPEGIKSVGPNAFLGTKLLGQQPFLIANRALLAASPNLCQGDVVIPEDVSSIGNYAFEECSSMESLTIPASVTSIGYGAFFHCSSLKAVSISASLSSIESFTFYGCSNLENVSIPEGVSSIGSRAFGECSSLKGVSIPASVTSIGDSAFSSCSSLKAVTIPVGVTSIGDSAFKGCSSLENVTIPESVTSIGDNTFGGCSSLENVTIPESVTSIGYNAFGGCSNLEGVTILEGIISIEHGAFMDCPSLKSVLIPKSVTTIEKWAFGYYYLWDAGHTDYDIVPIPGFLIQGYPGTAAETYAKENNFEFSIPAATTPAPEAEKADISKASVTLPQNTYTYTGKPLTPTVTVSYGGKTLSLGRDYTVAYTDNINAGTGKVTLTGIGGYQGSITKAFTIGKAGQAISGTKSFQKAYGGKAFTLNAKRTAGDGALSYSSSAPKVASVSQKGKVTIKGTGVATITVTAKETANYAPQTFQVEVRVSPKKPTLSTLKPKGGRRLAVNWKKDAKATGYEVWCSTSKNFKKGLKKANTKGNKVTSCQFSKLKVGKKYYVRLRSYKTVKANGKTIVLRSKWSSVKQSKKIKK